MAWTEDDEMRYQWGKMIDEGKWEEMYAQAHPRGEVTTGEWAEGHKKFYYDNAKRRTETVQKNTADLQASNTEKKDSKVAKGAETKADDGEFGQSKESAENEDDMKKASSGKRGKAAGKMLGFK